MNALSKEEVLHVADLAKLEVKEEEIEKYSVQLFDILSEIEKIDQVEVDPYGEILIAPTTNQNVWSKDEIKPMLSKEEIMHNVPRIVENYVVVPEVLHDELSEA